MAIGGFGGNDPAITLAHFKQLVARGRIHYFVAGGGFAGGFGPPGAGAFPGRGAFPGAGQGFPAPPSGGRVGGGPPGRGNDVANQIQTWVTKHFSSTTVDGMTLYDLTQAKAS
jgi:hypothetical protein